MSLKGYNYQIEHVEQYIQRKSSDKPYQRVSYSRKWLKKLRHKLFRRHTKTEIPNYKYNGWEY